MNNKVRIKAHVFLVISLLLLAVSVNSAAAKQPQIELEGFWVVLPPTVARSTAGYGIIKNTGTEADILLDIRSNAGAVMLHKTELSSGVARMVHMDTIRIEEQSEWVLEPLSFHLMFTELCPIVFTEGGRVRLLFEFEKSGVIEVEVPIKSNW